MLRKLNMQTATTETWILLKEFDEHSYVEKTFVEQIEQLYARIEHFDTLAKGVTIQGRDLYVVGSLADKFYVIITGTTIQDKGRFRDAFREFNWQKPAWRTYTSMNKPVVSSITDRVQQYNEKYKTNLQIEVVKA